MQKLPVIQENNIKMQSMFFTICI